MFHSPAVKVTRRPAAHKARGTQAMSTELIFVAFSVAPDQMFE
jgi:hypothetical protein